MVPHLTDLAPLFLHRPTIYTNPLHYHLQQKLNKAQRESCETHLQHKTFIQYNTKSIIHGFLEENHHNPVQESLQSLQPAAKHQRPEEVSASRYTYMFIIIVYISIHGIYMYIFSESLSNCIPLIIYGTGNENSVTALHGEVMACGYEDVQVMWSILDKSNSSACNITS